MNFSENQSNTNTLADFPRNHRQKPSVKNWSQILKMTLPTEQYLKDFLIVAPSSFPRSGDNEDLNLTSKPNYNSWKILERREDRYKRRQFSRAFGIICYWPIV